jgi:hypothetical protein
LTVTYTYPPPRPRAHTRSHLHKLALTNSNADQSSSHLLVNAVRPLLSILMAQNCYCPQPHTGPFAVHTVSDKGVAIEYQIILFSPIRSLCHWQGVVTCTPRSSVDISTAPVFPNNHPSLSSLLFLQSARIPQQVFLEYESGRGGNDLGCLPGSLEDVFEATISFRFAVILCGVMYCDVI